MVQEMHYVFIHSASKLENKFLKFPEFFSKNMKLSLSLSCSLFLCLYTYSYIHYIYRESPRTRGFIYMHIHTFHFPTSGNTSKYWDILKYLYTGHKFCSGQNGSTSTWHIIPLLTLQDYIFVWILSLIKCYFFELPKTLEKVLKSFKSLSFNIKTVQQKRSHK